MSSTQGLISAKAFMEKYNLTHSYVYVYKARYDSPFIVKTESGVFVNEKALIRRRNFYHRVWLEATDNYYKLIDGSTQYTLAKILAKYLKDSNARAWNLWMSTVLFSTQFMDNSLLCSKITDKMWTFWRFTRWLVRILERKQNGKAM